MLLLNVVEAAAELVAEAAAGVLVLVVVPAEAVALVAEVEPA